MLSDSAFALEILQNNPSALDSLTAVDLIEIYYNHRIDDKFSKILLAASERAKPPYPHYDLIPTLSYLLEKARLEGESSLAQVMQKIKESQGLSFYINKEFLFQERQREQQSDLFTPHNRNQENTSSNIRALKDRMLTDSAFALESLQNNPSLIGSLSAVDLIDIYYQHRADRKFASLLKAAREREQPPYPHYQEIPTLSYLLEKAKHEGESSLAQVIQKIKNSKMLTIYLKMENKEFLHHEAPKQGEHQRGFFAPSDRNRENTPSNIQALKDRMLGSCTFALENLQKKPDLVRSFSAIDLIDIYHKHRLDNRFMNVLVAASQREQSFPNYEPIPNLSYLLEKARGENSHDQVKRVIEGCRFKMILRMEQNRKPDSEINIDFDPYEVLGVDNRATNEEIKKAYRALALQLHPDRNQSVAGERFKKLGVAFAILSDEQKRAEYDKHHKSRYNP